MRPLTDAGAAVWRAVALVVVAGVVTAVALVGLESNAVAYDLVQVYVPAGERVLDGDSPYPHRDDPVLEQNAAYVYPPPAALLATPLTVLSDDALEIAGVLGSFAALFGALWLLGVRDVRCYAVFALWPPTILAWQNANLSVIVLLACAVVWRFRDTAPTASVAGGLGIAFKVILWPLSMWLLATKRLGAATAAVAVAATAVVGSWAVIGFEGLAAYPGLMTRLTEIETVDTPGISIFSSAIEIGASPTVGHLASVAVGGALLAASWLQGRVGNDKASFTLALLAVLAFAPIVWLHYLTLLAVPLAIYRPRVSAAWAIPLAFWVFALPDWPFELRKLFALAVVALLTLALLAPRHPRVAEALSGVRRSRGLRERST